MSRIRPFEGIHNFRDFGGYPAGDRRVKKGVLFRSGHHSRASDADLDAIAALKLATIVDLRRPHERQRHPSRRPEACLAAIIVNDDTRADMESWSEFIQTSDLSEESIRLHAVRFYKLAPFEPHYADCFGRYFDALACAEGPVLVHCMGGKDRTGILVALTHALLGVHQDDIVTDFLLTNDSGRFEREAPHFHAFFIETIGRAPSPEALKLAMGVEAHYLDAAFGAMAETHGSVERYIEDALGVDAKTRARIEARLLD